MAVKTQAIGLQHSRRTPVSKRTSQGTYDKPKNKHKRKNWKQYRGQG